MTNLILLIGGDGGTDRELRLALSKSEPACELKRATRRSEIEALRAPSLIVLDLSHEGGFATLRWIRTEPRYKRVPVFVLAPPCANVEDAYALGANSCFLRRPAGDGPDPLVRGIAAYASLIAESENTLFQ